MQPNSTTTERGQWAEDLATRYLEEAGYEVLQRNYRCALGEIDIIAIEESTLVFVEVRARSSDIHGHPLETIGPAKISRIIQAARDFIHHNGPVNVPIRFDPLSILLEEPPKFELVKEAFEA